MKTIKAIILTYIKMALTGLLGVVSVYLLLTHNMEETGISFWQVIGFSMLNFFFCFLFCLIFLLPLSFLESQRIKEQAVEELFKRYLPLITILPFAIFVWLIVAILPNVNESERNECYFSINCAILPLCLGPLGVWTFLKKLKA